MILSGFAESQVIENVKKNSRHEMKPEETLKSLSLVSNLSVLVSRFSPLGSWL